MIGNKFLLFFLAASVLIANSCVHKELDGKWKVESIDSVEIGDTFNEPSLEINSAERKYYGVTGVNNLNGNISIDEDKINFSDGPMTKMAADPHSMEVESAYIHALGSVTNYSIVDGKLYLKNISGQTVMALVAQ